MNKSIILEANYCLFFLHIKVVFRLDHIKKKYGIFHFCGKMHLPKTFLPIFRAYLYEFKGI